MSLLLGSVPTETEAVKSEGRQRAEAPENGALGLAT